MDSKKIIGNVRSFLVTINEFREPVAVFFAREAAIEHSQGHSVPASALMDSLTESELEAVVGQGPSWIHANLYITSSQEWVIGIASGAEVGNPNPSLNISVEPRPIEILD